MCSDFPVMEMAVAAVILNTLRSPCYWCQAAFLMNERPHPNVVLPLLSGCSKADVCGLPLSWCFWVLCCENLLENHVTLWKDWPIFKGQVWKQHTNIRQTEKKAPQEREKPEKDTNWERRPAVCEQIPQLLRGRPKAGHPWNSGEGMQPHVAGPRGLQPAVLRARVQHARGQARREVRLQVRLVLLRALQEVRDHDRRAHLQVSWGQQTRPNHHPEWCSQLAQGSSRCYPGGFQRQRPQANRHCRTMGTQARRDWNDSWVNIRLHAGTA